MKLQVKIKRIEEPITGVSKTTGQGYYFLPMVVTFNEEYRNGESAEHTLMCRTNKRVNLDKLRLYEGTQNTLDASVFFSVRTRIDKNGQEWNTNEINIYLPKELYV